MASFRTQPDVNVAVNTPAQPKPSSVTKQTNVQAKGQLKLKNTERQSTPKTVSLNSSKQSTPKIETSKKSDDLPSPCFNPIQSANTTFVDYGGFQEK